MPNVGCIMKEYQRAKHKACETNSSTLCTAEVKATARPLTWKSLIGTCKAHGFWVLMEVMESCGSHPLSGPTAHMSLQGQRHLAFEDELKATVAVRGAHVKPDD